jgi:hypothetical protein
MTVKADAPKQRMGVLTLQRVTPVGYKAEFQPLTYKLTFLQDTNPRNSQTTRASNAA